MNTVLDREVITVGTAEQNIRLLKKKLTDLPDTCPKCGEKEGWVQVRVVNPYDNQPDRKDNFIDGLFEAGPLGALIGAIIPVRKKVTYRCNKCDFKGEYKAR